MKWPIALVKVCTTVTGHLAEECRRGRFILDDEFFGGFPFM